MKALLAIALIGVSAQAATVPVVNTGVSSYRLADFSELSGTFTIDLALPVSLSATDERGRPQFQFNLWIGPMQIQSTAQGLRSRTTQVGDGGWSSMSFQQQGLSLSFLLPATGSFCLETYEYGRLEHHLLGNDGNQYVMNVQAVPEPGSAALALVGLLALYAGKRRRWTA